MDSNTVTETVNPQSGVNPLAGAAPKVQTTDALAKKSFASQSGASFEFPQRFFTPASVKDTANIEPAPSSIPSNFCESV